MDWLGDRWNSLMAHPIEWLTLALVIVTAIYAWLTWRIADASRDAANASKDAAAHAARAANAAVAGLEIAFEISPRLRFVTSEKTNELPKEKQILNLGVAVLNKGANVWIHSVEIEQYNRATQGAPQRLESEGPREQLLLATTKVPPLRLFKDDDRHYWSPSTWVPRDYVSGLLVSIMYSLDGSDPDEKRVSWAGEQGTDFEFLGADSKRVVREVDTTLGYSTLVPPGAPRNWI